MSPDDDALALHLYHHVAVHVISQGVHMGWVLILSLSTRHDACFTLVIRVCVVGVCGGCCGVCVLSLIHI